MELVWIVIGMFIGITIMIVIYHTKKTTGTLRIDHSNPEKDVYRFELDRIEDLSNSLRVVLKVDHNADLSYMADDSQN